jgi:hypothetical protein
MNHILLIPSRIIAIFSRNQNRLFKIALLVLVFITALYTKEYKGQHQLIINNNIGGVFYILFGSLLFSVVFRHLKPYLPVLLALGLTCLLEIIQWFRFPFMVELTRVRVFAYIFGNTFSWLDFVFYFIGAVIAFIVLLLLKHNETVEQ